MEDIKSKLKRYAELKVKMKEMEAEIEELNPEIKAYVIGEGVDKLPTNLGTFSVESRGTWEYSPAVEKLKEEEKAKGVAKKVITTSLKFLPAK